MADSALKEALTEFCEKNVHRLFNHESYKTMLMEDQSSYGKVLVGDMLGLAQKSVSPSLALYQCGATGCDKLIYGSFQHHCKSPFGKNHAWTLIGKLRPEL